MSGSKSSRLARAVGLRATEAIPEQPGASEVETDPVHAAGETGTPAEHDAPDPDMDDPEQESAAQQGFSDPQQSETGDDEQAMGGRHLSNPSDPCRAGDPAQPSLDDDPTTSLVGSLSLHMLSEHGVTGYLHLDDEELLLRHLQLHSGDDWQEHDITDHRFRPARALHAALLAKDE